MGKMQAKDEAGRMEDMDVDTDKKKVGDFFGPGVFIHTDLNQIRFELIPYGRKTVATLMGGTQKRREVAMVKKVQRLTHASSNEMRRHFLDASISSENLDEACDKVYRSCDICTSSCRQRLSNKISLSQVNEAFNEVIKAEFMVVYIKESK